MRLSAIPLSLIFAASVYAMELPAPPTGFSWREVPEIKAAFLMPSGWQFKRQAQGNTLALLITQGDIDKDGRFNTGLTINVLRNAKPGTAVEYADAFTASSSTTPVMGMSRRMLTSNGTTTRRSSGWVLFVSRAAGASGPPRFGGFYSWLSNIERSC